MDANPANLEAAKHMRIVAEELARRNPQPKPRVSAIIAEVCIVCGVTESDLFGKSHSQFIVCAKQVTTVCIRDLTGRSYHEIARDMCSRNHSPFFKYYRRKRDAETVQRIERVKARFTIHTTCNGSLLDQTHNTFAQVQRT